MNYKTIAKICKRIGVRIISYFGHSWRDWLICLLVALNILTHSLSKQKDVRFDEAISYALFYRKENIEISNKLNLCRDQVEFLDEAIRERRWR